MIDLEHTPAGELPPVRGEDGSTQLSRLTTTWEQRAEALAFILSEAQKMAEARPQTLNCLVTWTRGEPSILRVKIRWETTSAGPLACQDGVIEMSPTGGEVKIDQPAHYRKLNEELREMHSQGML